MHSETKLFTDDAVTFEYLDADETEFLYEEIFTRRSYLQHGVTVPSDGAPTVIDCGANIGLFSLQCLRENPASRVFAVEPAAAAFRCLERNLASASSEATCVQQLLGEVSAAQRTLHFFEDAPGESTRFPAERRRQQERLRAHAREHGLSAAALADATATSASVPATTVSELLRTWQVASVDLLKVDVEGDELNVLRGVRAADWPRVAQVVCEVHDVHGRLARVLSLLRRHGLRATAVQQLGGTVEGYRMEVPASLRLYHVYATRHGGGRGAVARGARKRARAED